MLVSESLLKANHGVGYHGQESRRQLHVSFIQTVRPPSNPDLALYILPCPRLKFMLNPTFPLHLLIDHG